MYPAAPSASPWRNPKIVFALLLVFLCGSLAGALAARYRYRSAAIAARASAGSSRAWTEGSKDISVERFRKELNLTDSQAGEVALVLDDFVKYYQTLQSQMDEVRADGKERILRLLNDEQKEKFGKMMSELQARQIR